MTRIFVPRESRPGESRVAATPESVERLFEAGLSMEVESGAGAAARHPDADYETAGAEIVGVDGWERAEVLLEVAPPTTQEAERLKQGAIVAGFLDPSRFLDVIRVLVDRQATVLSMELIPRISRAQSMDALSSQASLAGYKAVLLAASRLDRYFPLMMTAAGTIQPSRVVVLGAGVAGLQAVATARRLGAVVEVSDIRPEVEEQVESLGGRFIPLPEMASGEGEGGYAKEMGEEFLRRQREILTERLAKADVAITTAQIPGRPAPELISQEMVERMRPGSIVVDLAVSTGGNCALSRPDQEVEHEGVLVLGPSDLAAATPRDASYLYARNLSELVLSAVEEGVVRIDLEDEIFAACTLIHEGEVLHTPTRERLAAEEPA